VFMLKGRAAAVLQMLLFPKASPVQGYVLIVPPGTQYKLYYSMAPNNMYVSSGYLSSEGTVLDSKKAELFDVKGDVDNKNMLLIPKRKVSGEVTLPVGYLRPKAALSGSDRSKQSKQ